MRRSSTQPPFCRTFAGLSIKFGMATVTQVRLRLPIHFGLGPFHLRFFLGEMRLGDRVRCMFL